MNILNFMSSWWMIWSMKAKLQKMWVSEADMQWVDFTNMASLNQFAERIVPNLLKKNPQMAKMIKDSGWLQWDTKQAVDNVIDWL